MTKALLEYRGLFGDHYEPFRDLLIHHEPLHTRSALYDFEIKEHQHVALYQLFLISKGGGLLYASGDKIPLQSPCVLLIPSSRLHGFVFDSEVEGDVFTISELLFEQIISEAPSIFSSFDKLRYFSLGAGSEEVFELKNMLVKELSVRGVVSPLSLKLMFQLLLIHVHRSSVYKEHDELLSDDRSLNHFNTFRRLLKLHINEGRSVFFYAEKLGMTSVHLNRVCQSVAERSALQIIHDQVVRESKKYLNATTSSITEIAYFLGFKDPSHFSNFFKKKQGCSPTAYRKISQK